MVLVLVLVALAAAQFVLVLKMKEGKEWARRALTVVAAVSLGLAVPGGRWAAATPLATGGGRQSP